jgi:hypothetical protein
MLIIRELERGIREFRAKVEGMDYRSWGGEGK